MKTKGWIILLILLILLVLGNITMGIKHADTKASGEKGLASEWNKNHIIDDDVECAKHQHKEHVIENRTSFPAGPVAGQIIYRTDEKKLYIWDSAKWDELIIADNVAIKTGTHYWSCGGSQFHGILPATQNIEYGEPWNDGEEWVKTNQDNVQFIASVHLPDGAVITSCIVYGNAGAAAETWQLNRQNINWPDGVAVMGSANINTADNTIANSTVDNSLYQYFISTSMLDIDDRIDGARITYTL